jgi:hypothetical protein
MRAQIKTLPAPIGGLNARDSLADMPPNDAAKLDNWFPTPTSVNLRNGCIATATGLPGMISGLFAYNPTNGTNQLFAAAGGKIYNVTASGAVGAAVASGNASDQWQKVPFGSTAANGQFLYLVNGVDSPWLYNGSTWQQVTGSSSPIAITGTGITPSTFIQGVAFKQRLYFVVANSTQVVYLPVNSLGGAGGILDFGGFFRLGGFVQAVASWTVDNTSGLNEFFVAVSSNGEVVVFEGYDPSNAANWSEQATFRIGRPIGYRCIEKMGSDLAIICADGLFMLKDAMLTDRSQEAKAVSYKIQNLINNDVQSYAGNFGWQVLLYPIGNKVILNVPNASTAQSYQYVMNTITNAWCRFTGWNAFCFELFNDQLFFGGLNTVFQADTGLSDNGSAIVADAIQAFNFFDAPGQYKEFTSMLPIAYATNGVNLACSMNVDFDVTTPAVLTSYSPVYNTLWGSPWGSPWSSPSGTLRQWRGANGTGLAGGIHLGLTVQGAICQWQATQVAYQVGGPM